MADSTKEIAGLTEGQLWIGGVGITLLIFTLIITARATHAAVAANKLHERAARQAERKLMIAHMWRFDREILWLRDLVTSGRLGEIFKAKSHSIWLHEGPAPESWFVKRELAGGGALADMGVHAIDTLRFVLGDARPTKVFANVGTHFQDIELEDTATLLLEFEGGIVALIEAGWYHLYAGGLEGYTQVYGTKGYARALPSELHMHVEGVWSVIHPELLLTVDDLGVIKAWGAIIIFGFPPRLISGKSCPNHLLSAFVGESGHQLSMWPSIGVKPKSICWPKARAPAES
ncbi:MAG: Gfo/Idh/MocA family oxidoreductase, partial [Proteobacteria bacterium]|nr:Gfo/Idh/MocA family oxidoreductase [Pseudomonadota bacterium]